MFVMQAKFEIDQDHEDQLRQKAIKNKKEIEQATGLLSYECWRRELKDTVEYAFVSKWEKQEDFKAWISREEHVQEHKNARAHPSHATDAVKMTKTLHSYEVFDPAFQQA
ncbi:hypothetical protein GCM10011391_29420 [Pullulanibacillus camelliae]|uniref:ABM domain-containing protein n=1 Tax=Pullulanibacillus camelliae TaxID=1707096 RepID=A0A8J2YKI1_9BACL|nr:antibiotic biosynthesis monooxygenase [Pullulanibacillus camelliae]GGE48711.1 hypothetical protein GCM10011391_29420 [Pullulanibacillus camelliae]